jgi:hypothetical protein
MVAKELGLNVTSNGNESSEQLETMSKQLVGTLWRC